MHHTAPREHAPEPAPHAHAWASPHEHAPDSTSTTWSSTSAPDTGALIIARGR